MSDALSRRRMIGLGLAAVPALLIGGMAGAQAPACANFDALPAAQKGMRSSLGFKPVSPDPKKVCAGCTFFTPAAAGCGKCALLSGGVVAANSVCDSWAAKG